MLRTYVKLHEKFKSVVRFSIRGLWAEILAKKGMKKADLTTVHLFECTFYYLELELIFFQHRIGKCLLGVTGGFSESDTDRLTGKMTGKVCKTGKTINQVKQNKLTI